MFDHFSKSKGLEKCWLPCDHDPIMGVGQIPLKVSGEHSYFVLLGYFYDDNGDEILEIEEEFFPDLWPTDFEEDPPGALTRSVRAYVCRGRLVLARSSEGERYSTYRVIRSKTDLYRFLRVRRGSHAILTQGAREFVEVLSTILTKRKDAFWLTVEEAVELQDSDSK